MTAGKRKRPADPNDLRVLPLFQMQGVVSVPGHG